MRSWGFFGTYLAPPGALLKVKAFVQIGAFGDVGDEFAYIILSSLFSLIEYEAFSQKRYRKPFTHVTIF